MPFRIAAHLCGWPKDLVADRRQVMQIVRDTGYDGVEGFQVSGAEELVDLAALAAEFGLRLVNVGAPDPLLKAKLNATLGNRAAEVTPEWKGDHDPSDAELDAIVERIRPEVWTLTRYGLRPFHHIHLRTILETPADWVRVGRRIQGLWLLLDTGHLLAAHADPLTLASRSPQKIAHVHLKNFWTQDPTAGWNPRHPDFWKTSRFCDLAEGNTGLDVGAVLAALARGGYADWISVEEDHPQRDIASVLHDNREFLHRLGY